MYVGLFPVVVGEENQSDICLFFSIINTFPDRACKSFVVQRSSIDLIQSTTYKVTITLAKKLSSTCSLQRAKEGMHSNGLGGGSMLTLCPLSQPPTSCVVQ